MTPRAALPLLAMLVVSVDAAPPPEGVTPVQTQVKEGCRYAETVVTAKVTNLKTEPKDSGELRTGSVVVLELLKGNRQDVPQIISRFGVPGMTDTLGADLQDGMTYLMFFNAPGRENLIPRIHYDSTANAYNDKLYRSVVSIARSACGAFGLASAQALSAGLIPFPVLSGNMEPSLRYGELGLAKPLEATGTIVPKGEIVLYHSAKRRNMLVASRVVAHPRDSVEIRDGQLLVNGRTASEPYLQPERAIQPQSRTFPRAIVPEGTVFLLNDFRDLSDDSRTIGAVPLSSLIGQVVKAVSPGSGSPPRSVR